DHVPVRPRRLCRRAGRRARARHPLLPEPLTMYVLYAFVIALTTACGVHLVLSRHIVRTLLGITLISAAVNLIIFYAGRIGPSAPPVIAPGEAVLPATAANPL